MGLKRKDISTTGYECIKSGLHHTKDYMQRQNDIKLKSEEKQKGKTKNQETIVVFRYWLKHSDRARAPELPEDSKQR